MKNAAESAYQPADDEEGVADGAASLGADGGPAAKTPHGGGTALPEDFSDAFGDDAAWLNEELSDEELAALGEEDFGDEEFDDEAFEEELEASFEEDDELGAAPAIDTPAIEAPAGDEAYAEDDGYAEEAFADAVVGGVRFVIAPEALVNVVAATEGAVASAADGGAVVISGA